MTSLELSAKQSPINVISIGLDIKCRKVVTKSVLHFQGGRFCIKNGGISIHCADTACFLLDTPENRELLKSQC